MFVVVFCLCGVVGLVVVWLCGLVGFWEMTQWQGLRIRVYGIDVRNVCFGELVMKFWNV